MAIQHIEAATREVANFGGNVRFSPHRYYTPRSEEEVLQILDLHADGQIRVVGSRHSWSEAIVSDDVLIDLSQLNQVQIAEPAPGEIWATVGGGCQIKRLLDQLHARSQGTMPALGLITEQTIAGAISTATHGSGRHSLSHYMQEIRTAAYDPQSGRAKIYTWNDGNGLRAARCALGCLGVVLSVRFRCALRYLIAERVEPCDEIDEILVREVDFPLQQFYLVPHKWSWYVQRRSTSPEMKRSWFAGLYRSYWYWGIDLGLHLAIKLMVSLLDSRWLMRFFYRHLLSLGIVRNVTIIDESQRMLIMEHELFRHLEIEIFVPGCHVRRAAGFVKDVLAAFDAPTATLSPETVAEIDRLGLSEQLQKLRGSFSHHYVVTFRRVLPDDTLISTTAAADEPWYAISFITYKMPRDSFLAMGTFLLQSMSPLFGARPHWGKFFPLAEGEAEKLYPRLPDFREICRRVDPHGVFQNDFTRRVLGFGEPHSASDTGYPGG